MIVNGKVTIFFKLLTYCFLIFMLINSISFIKETLTNSNINEIEDFPINEELVLGIANQCYDSYYIYTNYLFAICLGALLNTLVPIRIGAI